MMTQILPHVIYVSIDHDLLADEGNAALISFLNDADARKYATLLDETSHILPKVIYPYLGGGPKLQFEFARWSDALNFVDVATNGSNVFTVTTPTYKTGE